MPEISGSGVVSYISNFSYVSEQSFVIMRERLLAGFDKIWIDCMNGDSRQTGKRTPSGDPDPSVFSTDYNREGIKKGTAVCVLVRHRDHAAEGEFAAVRYRDFWGAHKRELLEQSLGEKDLDAQYATAHPVKADRHSFRPAELHDRYHSWPKLIDMCSFARNGLMEKRGGALIDMDRESLLERMRAYYDQATDWKEWTSAGFGLSKDASGFVAEKVRGKVQKAGEFNLDRAVRYAVRPFDTQWAYYSDVSPLWNRSRPELFHQVWNGNMFLISRQKGAANPEGVPFSFCKVLGDDHYVRDDAYFIPFWLKTPPQNESQQEEMFKRPPPPQTAKANVSELTRQYLISLGFDDPDGLPDVACLPWLHALAVGFAPQYVHFHDEVLRTDWPRIPLPATIDILEQSAALGHQVALLLDTEAAVSGGSSGTIREDLKGIAQLAKKKPNGDFGAQITPASDLRLSAGWGRVQNDGVIMPGPGRMEEVADPGAWGGMLNVYLNDAVCWRNVPVEVWEFTIGGHQVIKKWLSYREHGTSDRPILGRPLTSAEARYVREVARRLSAIVLLQEELDVNYEAVITNTWQP